MVESVGRMLAAFSDICPSVLGRKRTIEAPFLALQRLSIVSAAQAPTFLLLPSHTHACTCLRPLNFFELTQQSTVQSWPTSS